MYKVRKNRDSFFATSPPFCGHQNRRDARRIERIVSHRMTVPEWPPPDPADELGLVALDYNLSPQRLVSAYRHGVFPWPDSSPFSPIPWVCPPQRAILEFRRLHVPRNLRKSRRALAALRFTV